MKLRGLNVLVLALALAVAVAVPGVAQEQSEAAESKVIALEKAWNQAYKFRDRKALAEILDESLILVEDDGRLQSRAEFLLGVDAAGPSYEQQAEPESISVHLVGDAAIATGIFRTRGFANGKPYMKRDRFVDTWVRRDGSWVCVAASATPMLQPGK